MRSTRSRPARLVASAALVAAGAVLVAGCVTSHDPQTTGTLPLASGDPADPAARVNLGAYAQRYQADPNNPEAALRYAAALRANGQRAQAVAILQRATMAHPHDRRLLGEYGRALADAGDYQQAFTCSAKPIRPTSPTGTSSPRRAPCSTRWAGTARHSAIT